MSLLTREALLSRKARRFKTVSIPETGDIFRIQSLTELERSTYENSVLSKKGGFVTDRMLDAKRRLVALCLVDADGKRLLSESDVDGMAEIDGLITGAIYDACQDHCGFRAGDIEGLVKNSETTHGGDSPSS